VAERVTGDSGVGQLPGQGWLGTLLLSFSVAGLPLVIFVLRRLGRFGGLVVEAGGSALFVRDIAMVATGAPAKLRRAPRVLLFVELATSGVATVAGLWAWLWAPFVGKRAAGRTGDRIAVEPGATRAQQGVAMSPGQVMGHVATAAVAATFVLHTAREAIYLRPGYGRRTPPSPFSSAQSAPVRKERKQ
jgi:hypothetical protein